MDSGFTYFLQLVVSGFSVGSIYAIIALGFVVIYKATKILNFAHGEIMMIGAYVCMVLISKYHVNFATACLITLSFSALMRLSSSNCARSSASWIPAVMRYRGGIRSNTFSRDSAYFEASASS